MSSSADRPPRALLVVPPSGLYRRDDRCQSRVEDQTVRVVLPPIDLAILGAIARRAGASPRVYDYPATGRDWQDLEADLRRESPDIVLFNVTAATLRDDLQVARLARQANPAARTIARGDCFASIGEEVFAQCPELDMALHGEVEEIFEALLRGQDPLLLEGLVARDPATGLARRLPGRPIVADLDSLPEPARDLLDNALYTSPETGRPLTVVKASRGCFSRCVFCPAAGRPLRVRSARSVVHEVRHCLESYGIRDFLFDGDTFTARKPWLLDLCGRLEAENLPIRWGCNSRVDTMDDERAQALRCAGCVLVAFGIESGDPEMLEKMRKGATIDQARRAVAACKRAGLGTHAFYIVGLPWETRQSLEKTYALMRELDTDLFDINIATPLPGTEFHRIAHTEGLCESLDPARPGSYAQAAVRSRALSARELTDWRRRTLLKLYARPAYIARILAQALRRGHLGHYLRAAWQRLGGLLGREKQA